MQNMYNAREWLWMQQTFGIGTLRAHEVYEHCGSAVELLSLSKERISQDGFFTPEEREKLIAPSFEAADEILSTAETFGAAVLTPDSPEYPDTLRNIHSMPLILYAQGDLSLLKEHYLIAMVGTRSPDEYGISAAKKLSGEIAALGGVVVSGLAYGIDAVCHRAALEAGGKTVAFIAGGLDLDYPKRNHALRTLIENPQNGLVLTEYPIGEQAYPSNFPVRNRLISGSSMATVVVQSKRRGGTMLTAGHALTQDRDLFAVPASIFSPIGEGCNQLLSQGAAPALSGADILLRYADIYGYPLEPPHNQQISLFADEKLPNAPASAKQEESAAAKPAEKPVEIPAFLNQKQTAVMQLLANGAASVDTVCSELSIPAGELLTLLTGLELFGLIELLPGRMIRCRIA